jgi:hypothetical protein
MFNPKENLLDQQLATSGLEMQILPVLAGISAATAVVGGVMASNQAKKQNKANKDAEQEQRELNEKIAKQTNEYNDQLDAADKSNYYAMRDYSHATNLANWEHGKAIQDYQYANVLKQYEKSVAIGNEQLGLNAKGAALAIESENAALAEAYLQNGFQRSQNMSALGQVLAEQNINQQGVVVAKSGIAIDRQAQNVRLQGIRSKQKFGQQSIQNNLDQLATRNALAKETAMVENLAAQGKAQLGQAGKSMAKRQQSTMASLHRSLISLDSELSGKYKQAAIQMAQLNADASLAEMDVGINLQAIGLKEQQIGLDEQRIEFAIQNAQDDYKFNETVLAENINSAIKQSERNIEQIQLEREIADFNTAANVMIEPEKMPYSPAPELPPERVFVDRMEAIPGFVPPAQQQNVWAPLIQGVGNAATGLMGGIDPATGKFYGS